MGRALREKVRMHTHIYSALQYIVKILKEKSLHEYTVQIERAQFSLQNLNGQLKLERKGRMEVNNQQLTGHNMQVL